MVHMLDSIVFSVLNIGCRVCIILSLVPIGQAVSVSWDGNYIAFGGSGDYLNDDATAVGACWAFQRNSSGTYKQVGSALIGSGYSSRNPRMGERPVHLPCYKTNGPITF